ncbi:MAG: hypothetical protein HOP34_07425 [Methylococcaceae bacterium]|nr:hypothetical protein [Methylococcaceae bacterium]
MVKLILLGGAALLLAACSYGGLPTAQQGYFADGFNCKQASQRKEKVFIDKTVGVVEIPLVYDANVFANCMRHRGRPVAQPVAVGDYLAISRACLQAASATTDRDASYADCIARSHLQVDVITGD